MKLKFDPKKLLLKAYNNDVRFENEESSDKESTNLPSIPPLEGDKEVNEGKGFKIFTLNKLLTRPPISLLQINAGKTSHKLRKLLYILYQHNQITKKFTTV